MAEFEVIWHAEGAALIEADNKDEAESAFYDARDFYMEDPDFLQYEAVPSP